MNNLILLCLVGLTGAVKLHQHPAITSHTSLAQAKLQHKHKMLHKWQHLGQAKQGAAAGAGDEGHGAGAPGEDDFEAPTPAEMAKEMIRNLTVFWTYNMYNISRFRRTGSMKR